MFYLTTDASPVSGLQCQGPNTEDATLLMSWVRPSGQYSAFQVILNHTESINFTSTCCSHNVSDLRHYTCYKLTVKTQSCGRPSTAVSQKCWTGITSRTLNIPDDIFLIQVCIISCFVSLFFFFFLFKDPPIVQDYKPLVTEKTHNRFSIQIDPGVLNDTNGPVTHFGVLVANKSPGRSTPPPPPQFIPTVIKSLFAGLFASWISPPGGGVDAISRQSPTFTVCSGNVQLCFR